MIRGSAGLILGMALAANVLGCHRASYVELAAEARTRGDSAGELVLLSLARAREETTAHAHWEYQKRLLESWPEPYCVDICEASWQLSDAYTHNHGMAARLSAGAARGVAAKQGELLVARNLIEELPHARQCEERHCPTFSMVQQRRRVTYFSLDREEKESPEELERRAADVAARIEGGDSFEAVGKAYGLGISHVTQRLAPQAFELDPGAWTHYAVPAGDHVFVRRGESD